MHKAKAQVRELQAALMQRHISAEIIKREQAREERRKQVGGVGWGGDVGGWGRGTMCLTVTVSGLVRGLQLALLPSRGGRAKSWWRGGSWSLGMTA